MAKLLKNCNKHFFCIFEMVYVAVVTTKKSQEKIDLEHLFWSRSLWGVIIYNFSQENATKIRTTSQLRYGLRFYTLTSKISKMSFPDIWNTVCKCWDKTLAFWLRYCWFYSTGEINHFVKYLDKRGHYPLKWQHKRVKSPYYSRGNSAFGLTTAGAFVLVGMMKVQ